MEERNQNKNLNKMKMESILVRLLIAYKEMGYTIEEMNHKYTVRESLNEGDIIVQEELKLTFNGILKIGVVDLIIPYPHNQKELFSDLKTAVDLEIERSKRLNIYDYETAVNLLCFKNSTRLILQDIEKATHYKDIK